MSFVEVYKAFNGAFPNKKYIYVTWVLFVPVGAIEYTH